MLSVGLAVPFKNGFPQGDQAKQERNAVSLSRSKAVGAIQQGFMKEVPTSISGTLQTWQNSAQWYEATTLSERIALLQKLHPLSTQQTLQHISTAQTEKSNSSCEPPSDQSSPERASQHFNQWKERWPFHQSEQLFAQRLAAETLTEDMLLTLLAQSAETMQAAFPEPPSWLVGLISSFEHQDTSHMSVWSMTDPQAQAIFQIMQPLLTRGFARLQAGITALREHATHLPFDPQQIGLLLFPHIFDQLMAQFTRTLVLELNVARIQGHLRGETPEQRFEYFLQQLAQPEQMLTLLAEYPVLARQMVETIERWTTCELEFLQHLCDDWPEICALFSPTEDPGLLSEIREGAGDLHQGGHSVNILTWSSGLRLVYKPRPLAMDMHFQECLTWLNACGYQPAFRTMKLLTKDTHGWCEYISAQSCTSPAEVERFYQRVGGYLALLYILEATDFHIQNLIASGEDPMLIDLETLFHPRFSDEENIQETVCMAMINHSVLRVGLLPQYVRAEGDSAGFDLSGLTGQANQTAPFAITTWQGLGTDEMHAVKQQKQVPLGAEHRPKLRDQEIETLDYKQAIMAGFTAVYQLLLEHRDELLATILPRFTHDEVRVLVRPTQQYVLLQTDGFHPNVLRNALDRDRLFERLWIGLEPEPPIARMILAERDDLWHGDIPKFTTTPTSRNMVTARGEIIADFFPESSLSHVKNKIQGMGELDLTRQLWVIQASLSSLALNTNHIHKHRLHLHSTEAPITKEWLLNEALAIGKRLQALALIKEETVNWLGVNILSGREWCIMQANLDLYSGLPGIMLFLAYLGALTAEESYTTLARFALQTLRMQMRFQQTTTGWSHIGAFNGAGSVIYLLAHLGTLWHEQALYQEAAEIVAQLPDLICTDTSLDVMGGSAGCIAALLSLYACAPSEQTLATAIQCGDHLLKHACTQPQGIGWILPNEQVPLAGMGHGNAGIALNLLRLWAVSKEERFHEAALAALAYERSLFSSEHHNWPDLRMELQTQANKESQIDGKEQASYMMAWCHGAPGIGLARLGALPYHNDVATRAEIHETIHALFAEGFGRNHSLCHGDMGNLETCLVATQLLPELYPPATMEPLQASLLQSISEQGWRSGMRMDVETPGLMLGLAGIGYALLRQAAPERVPSILLLAPPQQETK